MHLLIIEDESEVRKYLLEGLSQEGYGLSQCTSIQEVDTLLVQQKTTEPDVIVMDRLLHGYDCADRIHSLKNRWPRSSVLVLSAIGGPSDKSKMLDNGADDYLSKPFALEELSA